MVENPSTSLLVCFKRLVFLNYRMADGKQENVDVNLWLTIETVVFHVHRAVRRS